MDKKRNAPEIRFAGFTDDWEQRKLGEIGELSAGGDIEKDKLNVNGKYPVLANGLTNNGIIGYYDEYEYEAPAVTITGRGDVGVAIARDTNFNAVVRLVVLSKIKDHNSKFLECAINLQNTFVESTGVPQLTVPQFSKYTILVPKLDEQIAIGNFFKQLDETIALHQREYEKYKNLKISYLEKMFPKENEQFPELRFPEFTDAWEQRKLGDCIEDYIERTTIQNQYPVLTSSQKQGIVFQEDYFADRQVTTENNVGYFVLPKGYFTYRSRSDNGVFRFNRNDLIDKGIISYFYPVFRIKGNDSNFFLQLLNSTIDEQVSFEAEGTGQKVLSLKKFKNVVVTIPSLHEQATIGNFFKQLDETIALHQRELEKYKKIKQSYLEKMFI